MITQRRVDSTRALRDTVPSPMRPVLAALMLCCLALPARAGFTVCNHTAHAAKVALGRFTGTDWASQGWWTIAPGACATVLKDRLKARYYYLYASDGSAGGWDGSRSFCTSSVETFDIAGRGDCAARGYDRKGFFQVDTGNRLDFTQALSQ